MPANLRSHALVTAYRERLRLIRDRVQAEAERRWPAIEQLDSSDWSEWMSRALASAQTEAVRVSAGFLSGYLTSELGEPTRGPNLDPRPYAGRSRSGDPLAESLRSPLIGTLGALKEGRDPAEALRLGLERGRRMVEMDLMHAARASLQDGMERDERIEGWQRAVNGTCGACLGDIAVEVSVQLPGIPLRVHPNCLCQTVPVVSGVRNTLPLPSGREIFERMGRAEQDEQFGAEKAEALRSGDLGLADLVATSPLSTQDDFITERPFSAVK